MIARAEAFERDDLALDAARDRDDAGARRDAVDQHGAGAAFAEPAAIFRSVQFEIVAQHIEQRGIGRGVDLMDPAIDRQADRGLRHDRVPAPAFALQNVTSNAFEDTVCIQTCKPGVPPLMPCCPVYEQTGEANGLLFGSGLLRAQGRLTAFGRARNIIRIRTRCPAAAMRSRPPEPLLRRVVTL